MTMGTTRRYELRLFDRTLVEFSITDDIFGPRVLMEEYDETARSIMPCGFVPDGEGIWRWLESRSIPTNRRNAAKICHELGFTLGDTEALYVTSLGLSLNDSYWVVPRGFSGCFDDYNLYENPFSEAIGALAVKGEPRGGYLSGNTPELTTDGTLRKGWRIVDGKRILYKGSSDGYVPGEPFSEYLASLVARDLGLNAVTYGLDKWEGELCSTCVDFATKEVSYVPFAIATGYTDLPGALWWFSSLGQDHFENFVDMLTLDVLLCNTDRHLTNFGVLRDNNSGKAVGIAPIFDNGRALFPNVPDDDPKQFALESQLRTPAFGGHSFEELLSRIASERQHELLRNAVRRGIVGAVHAPQRRVASLDSFLRQRANELDTIKPVDHEELVEALGRAMKGRTPNGDSTIRIPLPQIVTDRDASPTMR